VAFGSARFGTTTTTAAGWTAAAAGVGLTIAAATVLGPAYRGLRHCTVAAAQLPIGRIGAPAWTRYGLDVALFAAAGIVFWLSGRNGYQLVLAPEGVPGIAVSYWAFAGPALLWAGAGLLAWRLTDLLLGRGRRLIGAGLRPVAGNLAPTAAAMMARQRRQLTRAAFSKLIEAVAHLRPEKITWHAFAAALTALYEQQRLEYGQEPAHKLELVDRQTVERKVRETAERNGLDPAEVMAELKRILAAENEG